MDIISVAPELTEGPGRAGESVEGERNRLYDALAALPFEERIAAIELVAERMGV